ncbi:MAG TPA: diacylglycerol kinase family protein [Streptosporangiaceae bacterium]|nr:diacylglycerol kinase family protein [Streptosporangiaceae bacterium]
MSESDRLPAAARPSESAKAADGVGVTEPRAARERWRAWLARLSFVLAGAAVVILLAVAGLRSIAMLGVALGSAAVSLAAAYWFLAERGLRRWLALALLVLSPITVIVIFALKGLLWVSLVSAAAWLLAGFAARAALAPDPNDWRMPELPVDGPSRRAFLIMNPRSGGGKVAKYDLKHKAEALGAEVHLIEGPGPVDVKAVAERAVADGADLLGVAGGDGTQALVAGVAAEHGLPFVVITAGTRNHFALDLGLDRDNPAACLAALSDGVDLQVDLGAINGRTFVNNASFGAYAEIVESPQYRDDKRGSTLDLLPEMLSGRRGTRLTASAGHRRVIEPQALLVANNPYGMGDIAGLGRRARLDGGVLGVVGVRVRSARDAAGLLRRARSGRIRAITATEVTIDGDTPDIPVGIDGESVSLPGPVRCTIRPGALRVRVPRQRPGVPAPRARMDWARLRELAVHG